MPDLRRRLRELVDAFPGHTVAVVGDFVLDRFVHGLPKRISREAPVLILRYAGEDDILGGGANTAANIASLGGTPLPAGAIGDDAEGRRVRELFARAGIDGAGLVAVPGYATPLKTRILGGGIHSIRQQVVRIDRESELPSRGQSPPEALASAVAGAAARADAVVICDYGYGSGHPGWLARLRGERPGVPILVDSRFRLSEFAGCDAATPNEEELERTSRGPIDDDMRTFERAGGALRERLSCRALLVTRGSRGMALFEEARAPRHLPVYGTDQVADVTGAGDTVMAAFALALASGASYLEAAALSNFAGGVVVMKMGTATVSPGELREAIESDRTILPRLSE